MDPLRVAEDEAKQIVLSQQYTTSFHENKDVLMKGDTLRELISPELLGLSFQDLKGKFKVDFESILQILLSICDVAAIKEFLVKEHPHITEIKSAVTTKELIDFLSKFCFFSCFGLLEEVVTHFKSQEAHLILERFTDHRTKWYKRVLASDFAKKGLKDEDVITDNRIEMQFELRLTKVTTTLHDFERFLSNEFQDYQMFIALYAVHESNLTFVCTVPAFIEEKLVDHIIKNQYKLSSWGLQDVIIWDTSVFDKPVDQLDAKIPVQIDTRGSDKRADPVSGDSVVTTIQMGDRSQMASEDDGYLTTKGMQSTETSPKNSEFVLTLTGPYKQITDLDEVVEDHIIYDLKEPFNLYPAICPPITKRLLMNWILHESVPASFCLVALMGLPSSGKSQMLRDVFSSAIQLKTHTVDHYMHPTMDEKGLSMYHLCVLGGEPHNQFAWSFTTKRYGARFSILSHIVRQAALYKQNLGDIVFKDEGTTPLFDDSLLDQHFEWLRKSIEKNIKYIVDQKTNQALLQGGITLVNVMDVGVNKAVYCLLPFILANCHKLVRLILYSHNRDGSNHMEKAELKEEKYRRGSDHELLLQWKPRLSYLLEFATVGYQREQKGCTTIMVPTIKQQDYGSAFSPSTLQQKLHTPLFDREEAKSPLKDEIMKQAKSQNIDCVFRNESAQFLPISVDHEESIQQSKIMLEKLIAENENFRLKLPLKWIFLRSIIASIGSDAEPVVIVRKSRIHELALKCQMTNEEVDKFLKTFTDFGSILYIPISSVLKEYVIVDIYKFSSLLSELFYPKRSESIAPSFGIITANEAENILHSIRVVYMKIITSLGMVATINNTSRIILEGHQLKIGEVCYFIPLARTTLPDFIRLDDSAQIVITSINCPADMQACITHSIMERIPEAFLVATESCNITKFKFRQDKGPAIDLAFLCLDTKTELQLLNEDEAVLNAERTINICADVLTACCIALQKKSNQIQDFNIGLWCKKKKIHHFLYSNYESDLCDDCQEFYEENARWKCWTQAVKKCGLVDHNKDHRLQKCKPLKPEEMLDIAKELAKDQNQQKLSLLASKFEIPPEELKMLQGKYSGWQLTMSLLLSWQSHRKEDHLKRELVTILKELGYESIALRLNPPTIMY